MALYYINKNVFILCDGSAKGVAKRQHLHECCIFENSKLRKKGKEEEEGPKISEEMT